MSCKMIPELFNTQKSLALLLGLSSITIVLRSLLYMHSCQLLCFYCKSSIWKPQFLDSCFCFCFKSSAFNKFVVLLEGKGLFKNVTTLTSVFEHLKANKHKLIKTSKTRQILVWPSCSIGSFWNMISFYGPFYPWVKNDLVWILALLLQWIMLQSLFLSSFNSLQQVIYTKI